MGMGTNVWSEMIDNEELIDKQYDVIAGRLPEKYNEVVLVVDKNNEIKHRAKREIKRTVKPGAGGLVGSRGETHCGYRAKPLRSLRQSLNRRKPTSGADSEKKNNKVLFYHKAKSKNKICTAYVVPFTNFPRKERQRFCGTQNHSNQM